MRQKLNAKLTRFESCLNLDRCLISNLFIQAEAKRKADEAEKKRLADEAEAKRKADEVCNSIFVFFFVLANVNQAG